MCQADYVTQVRVRNILLLRHKDTCAQYTDVTSHRYVYAIYGYYVTKIRVRNIRMLRQTGTCAQYTDVTS